MPIKNDLLEHKVCLEMAALLQSFCLWLNTEAKGKKIVFLAREGWTIGEYYQQLFPNEEVTYVRSSRALLNTINIKSKEDFLAEIRKPTKKTTLADLFQHRFSCHISETNFFTKKYLTKKLSKEQIIDLITTHPQLNDLATWAIQKSEQKRQRVLNYYTTMFSDDSNIALVDIGYNGTFRKEIQKLFPNKSFSGFYLGTLANAEGVDAGFMFNKVDNDNDEYKIENNVLMIEYLLSRDEGTTIDISENGKPVLLPNTLSNKVRRIQNNISKLIHNEFDGMDLNSILQPNIDMSNYFKYEYLEDVYRGNKKHYLISQNIFDKFFRKKRFIKNSAWRNGALKQLNKYDQ